MRRHRFAGWFGFESVFSAHDVSVGVKQARPKGICRQ
jgi:hypothetical protein